MIPQRVFVWLAAMAVWLLVGVTAAHADRIPANCTGSGLGINLFTSIPDVHIGDTLYYSINVFNGIAGTGRIVCDATSITAFIVTPDGVSHPITLSRTTLHSGESDFYLDVVSYVVRAQDVRPDGTLLATATDSGTIHQNDTDSVGGGFQGVNTEVNIPCVLITAQCVPSVGENGAITFTGTVTNCGNNTLVGVTVTNFHDGGNFTVLFPTNLARGAFATFSGSWVPVNPCLPSTAVLTVRASDEFTSTPRLVTNLTSVTCQNVLTAGIRVTKTCPVGPVAPGELLTFSGSVSNTGNVTLTNVVVVNNQPVANTVVFTQPFLAPGELVNFTGSYNAPTNCSVSDTLTATARSRCGVAVTSSATANCTITTTPGILVTANCPGGTILPGGTFTYTGTVQNTGNITLTNVIVTADRPAANTTVRTITLLAPGAISNFTATVTMPAGACSVATTFSARGKDICTPTITTNTTVTTCFTATAPGIVATLACPVVTSTTGGSITYTGTVRNSGNVTLTNVYVMINQPTPGSAVIGPITLLAGVTQNFTSTFTSPADSCSVSSTVTATGNDNCSGSTVTGSASATCTLNTTVGLVLTQSCPVEPVVPGGLVSYSGTIRNSGNITLTNIVILNNLSGATPIFTTTTLAPGVTLGFSGSYTATTNCSTTSTSTGTGRSICGVVATGVISSTCTILTTPSVLVTATCPGGTILPGATFTYTGTVQNNGNITLTNVIVTADRPVANTTVRTIALLPPGAISNFTASVTMPANACSVATTFSARGKDICTPTLVTNTVVTTCFTATAPGIVATLSCPVVTATTGGSITYTGTVRNSGNVTLNNVFVVINQPTPGTAVIGPITLLPGVTQNFTSTFTAPSDSCSVSASVTATGNDNCSNAAVTNTVSTTCTLNTTAALVLTQSCPVGPVVPGSLVTYNGTIQNSGNITLTNIVILNNLSGATPIFTTSTLAPGATLGFSGSYTAPTNCSTTSTSTGTGRSICGVVATGVISSTCTITTAPAVVVTAICPGGTILPGGTFTYTGTVRNAGNITLTNVIVSSDRPSANTTVYTVALLAPGAVSNFTASVTVPANACSVATTFSAVGKDICTPTLVTNTVITTCTVTTAPAIIATLSCPVVSTTTGGSITYTGTVRNSGNVTLNNVFVRINQPTPGTAVIGPITLLPGVTQSFSSTFTSPSDSCSVTASVTATGNDNCSNAAVTNTVSTTCTLLTTPGIAVTKVCPVSPVVPGQLLTFSGSVSNTGNITLTNIVVLNNQPVANTLVFSQPTLAPGEAAFFTGSYLAPTNCSISDTLTATGRSRCGIAVTNTATASCAIVTTPGIYVIQTCPVNPVLLGGILTYSGIVSNSGNITLTNIIVVSDRPGVNTVIFTRASLAPGATASFSGSYEVPIDCCIVTSTVKATGQGCFGVTVTDTDTRTCTLISTPRITVTKVCPSGILRVGDLLTYSGTVSNAGNITLINVYVVNNTPTSGSPVIGPLTLAPGETMPYTASYTVPADFCGTDIVTATGLNVCTFLPVSNSVTNTCPITTAPRIAITKSCPVVPVIVGELFTYTGSVSNAGNVTLINVYVVDNMPTNNTPVIGPITLVPGATASFSGSYLAPLDCCEVVDTVTARGQNRCNGSNVTATATAFCALTSTPGLQVVQSCPSVPIPMGTLYSFSGYVTNTGNITLTNVLVYSPLGTNSPLVGPIELAPGEIQTYSGSYTVPFGACSVDITAIGRSLCSGLGTTNVLSCLVDTTAGISVRQTCPPGTTTAGSLVTYTGSVSNTGNIILTNVMVFSSQPGGSVPVYGPISLLPGASAVFTNSYTATGGTGYTTNTTFVTNSSLVITTNTVVTITTNQPSPVQFGTIDSVSQVVSNRFSIGTNFNGLTYDGADHGYAATQFYAIRKDTGISSNFFDTITASTGTTTDRFVATNTSTHTFDALTYAANDVGYGPLLFYYLSHDTAGVSTFGSITPGGVVGVVADHFVVGSNFDALTYSATDIGYGANMFYYVRHDASGLSTFGTINPALPGTITDRFTIGTNVDALVFTDLTTPGYGANNFYYLRHDAAGVSTFGTIFVTGLTTATVTDRFTVGTNAAELTFTATDAGFGANLFYFLRGTQLNYVTNSVTNYSTNLVTTIVTNNTASFTSTNTLTAVGMDVCQSRVVVAAADCFGPVTPPAPSPQIASYMLPGGIFSMTFLTQAGTVYTIQYKNDLNDPIWTDLQVVIGTGGLMTVNDPSSIGLPMRFYRLMISTP